LAVLREAIVFDFNRLATCRGRSATRNVQPSAWSPFPRCAELGAVIVSSILGENVKAAADKAYAEIVKIMAKTEGK